MLSSFISPFVHSTDAADLPGHQGVLGLGSQWVVLVEVLVEDKLGLQSEDWSSGVTNTTGVT